MNKLKFAFIAALTIATASAASAQTYLRQAPGAYGFANNVEHSDSLDTTSQHKGPGENGGG